LTQKVIMPPLSPDESPGFLLAQVCRLHHTRAQAMLEALGLYRGQPPVLHFLHEEDGLTHSALAARLNVTPATVTKMLQRMENAGWVIRRPDAVDQRVSRAYLTDAGRAVRAEMDATLRRLDEEAFAGFSTEERLLFRRFLLQTRANLITAAGEDKLQR